MKNDIKNESRSMNGCFRIMEYAWLVIALSSLCTAIVDFYYHSWNAETAKFFILAVVAFGMYIFRRKKRIRQANGRNA